MDDDEIWSDNEDEGTLAVANGCIRDRILACINACAGMADPAAEIQEMRESIREAHRFARDILKNHECGHMIDSNAEQLLTKLQPFTTP